MEMAMISSSVAETSSFLNWLEANMDLEAPVKVPIQTLRIKATILNIFFACKGKFHIDDKNLKSLLDHINILGSNALEDIQLLWFDMNQNSSEEDWRLPENLDGLISRALEKLDLINPHIQQAYTALSSSTRSMSSKTDALVEFIKALVEIMKELLSSKAQSIVPVEKEMKTLMQELLFLMNFLVLTENWCGNEHENLKELHKHAESMADNTACLLYLCSKDSTKMDEHMINEIKLQFSCQLQRMKPTEPNVRESYIGALKASKSSEESDFVVDEHFLGFLDSLIGNMIGLSNLEASSISAIHRVESLHDELKILRYFLVDSSAQKYTQSDPKLNDLLLHIKTLVCEVGCVIYSCYDIGITEAISGQMYPAISDLLQEFNVIKETARLIYDNVIPKSLRSNFPKTDELGFMDFMIQKLKELLNSKADSIVQLQYQIEAIHGSIVSLRGDFVDIAEQPSEHVELNELWARFKDIVYHTEYAIDSAILRDELLWCHKFGIFYVIEDMMHIQKAVDQMKDRSTNNTESVTSSQTVSNLEAINVAEMPIHRVELFADEANKIIEQLTNSLTQLYILSIVGMPGIGKTTLANSLYENPQVHLNFHVHARCCVTQTFDKRRLFLEILRQVRQETDPGEGMSDDDLAARVYQSLKGQKYLIFLDDLWDIRPWDEMKTSFPDDKKGSRIMFTSRFHDIASKIDTKSTTFHLHELSDAMSWELLQVKLFNKDDCPQELLEVGKKLATECKGLPLSIDLIAGLLRNMERRKRSWNQFAGTLNKHLLEGQDGCTGVLELSYNNLPSHLRPCFLYFGAFSEDEEVPTRKLMWLWIAEGFVQLENDDQNGSIEDAAEKYLNDLIARSLVTVSQTRSDGGVKAIRVHDLLYQFAFAKAQQDHFLESVGLFSDLHPYRHRVESTWDFFGLLLWDSKQCYPHRARSLLCTLPASVKLKGDSRKSFENFKLLRLFYIPQLTTQDFSSVSWMVHLRFLYISSESDRIPSEISNLKNLETFVLRISSPEVQSPTSIWSLKRLRHFKVDRPYLLPEHSLENPLKFDNLQTLSMPLLHHGEDCEKIMRGLPNLRKLSCIFVDSWDDSSNCNHFPVLDFLTRLESLKVAYEGKMLHPCHEFQFPPHLKKLTMSKFHLPWSDISTIGKLSNLQVLKLLDGSFSGKTWDMTEGEFLNLKFLKLEALDIAQWDATEDSLPSLEKLVLSKCNQLEEIPSCLGDIPTLRKLDLIFCSQSVWISARMIEENQKDMGNEQFAVTGVQKPSMEENIKTL